MATIRNRSRVVTVNRGYAVYNTGVQISGNGGWLNTESHSITDTRRSRGDGNVYPLDILHYVQEGGTLSGKSASAEFREFYPTVYETWNNFPHLAVPETPSDSYLANNAMARTNPSRPYVDIPAEVLQMTDFLYLIRKLGRKILSKVGQTNINYQFGIAPLIGDLAKISTFMHQFGKRMAEMERLQSAKGYRRTVKQGTFSNSSIVSKVLQSQGVFITANIPVNTKVVCKTHVRWTPSGDSFTRLSAKAKRLLTSQVMQGLLNGRPIIDLKTVWEILPWSWLIDYAIDISGYLRATRNIISCNVHGPFVMKETTTTYSVPGGSGTYGSNSNKLSWTACKVSRVSKTRKYVGAFVFAEMPCLSKSQMSILASLWVRGRR